MGLQDLLRRQQRKVGEMLVINRVKLILLDQAKQMRKLKRKYAIRLESHLQSFHKIVQIRNLGKNIVSQDQIGRTFGLHQILLPAADAKEFHKRANSLLRRDLGHIRGGFDSENRNTVASQNTAAR